MDRYEDIQVAAPPARAGTDPTGAARPRAYLIRVAEAAQITGLPASLIRKSFIAPEKRPANVPDPPPHKRIGRSVYIVADRLAEWIDSLGEAPAPAAQPRRGRPTVAARIARRAQDSMRAHDAD